MPSFSESLSLLRAANALSFPKLANFAKARLQDYLSDDPSQVARTTLGFGLQAIVLARQCGIPSALKRAFYEALRYENAIKDLERSAGDPATAVSERDFERLKSTKPRLTSVSLTSVSEEIYFEAPQVLSLGCPHPPAAPELAGDIRDKCTTARVLLWEFWAAIVGKEFRGSHDPIADCHRMAQDEFWKKFRICAACKADLRVYWTEKRDAVWAQLSDWLQLEEEAAPSGVQQEEQDQPQSAASTADPPSPGIAMQIPVQAQSATRPPTSTASTASTSGPSASTSGSRALPRTPDKGKRRADTLRTSDNGQTDTADGEAHPSPVKRPRVVLRPPREPQQ